MLLDTQALTAAAKPNLKTMIINVVDLDDLDGDKEGSSELIERKESNSHLR